MYKQSSVYCTLDDYIDGLNYLIETTDNEEYIKSYIQSKFAAGGMIRNYYDSSKITLEEKYKLIRKLELVV